MGKQNKIKNSTVGRRRGRKQKYGRPLKPKDTSYFKEDPCFRKEVVNIITAYLVYTQELGLSMGFFSVENHSVQPTNQTLIRIPAAIQKHHRCRFTNLIRMTRLAMDPEPAQQFETLYKSIYLQLCEKVPGNKIVHLVTQAILNQTTSFPSLNSQSILPAKRKQLLTRLVSVIAMSIDNQIFRKIQPQVKVEQSKQEVGQ